MKRAVGTIITILVLQMFGANAGAASDKVKFNFSNADIERVVETYAKASGQKFIIDPAVRGKITIMNPDSISVEEAFSQLSAALAANSYAISKREDLMVIMHARAVQRNYIDVVTQLPPLKPERMYTMIITLKNRSAEDINRQLRILSSKDGELVPVADTNQIIVSDWASNLHRISKILAEVDKPLAAGTKRPSKGEKPAASSAPAAGAVNQ